MEPAGSITIREKALKSIAGHHPWIFSGAVEDIPNNVAPGEVVDLVDQSGGFLARGFFNPESQIMVRILSFSRETISIDSIRERLENAFRMRKSLPEYSDSDAWRIVYGEADRMPGLVVDKYGDYLSVQFHSVGWERIKDELCQVMTEVTGAKSVFDGSDSDMREREGLPTENRVVYGEELPDRIEITEFGRKMAVDMQNGQKSGLYLDQKFNHQRIVPFARGRRVLDVFSYTGGFGLAALQGECRELWCVDIAENAEEKIRENVESNRFNSVPVTTRRDDAFDVLRDLEDSGEQFDMIILDPPAFCKRKSAVTKACRGYKDINRIAMKLLSPDGILVSCSCSRPLSDELFTRVLWQSSVEAGRDACMLGYFGQGADHPILLTFPESKYLKCAVMQVL